METSFLTGTMMETEGVLGGSRARSRVGIPQRTYQVWAAARRTRVR